MSQAEQFAAAIKRDEIYIKSDGSTFILCFNDGSYSRVSADSYRTEIKAVQVSKNGELFKNA